MIIRGHQVASNGYNYPFSPNQSIMTIFSASSNDNDEPNKAAFVTFQTNGDTTRKVTYLPT